jgi:hypothetical protein
MSDVSPPNFRTWPVDSGNDVDRLLIAADGMLIDNRRNAMMISGAIMRIVSERRYGIRYLEHRYRTLDSATFLIAMPKQTAPAEYKVLSPDMRPMPYYLLVCVNGRREADAKLADLKISYEANLDRLDQTGFLMVMRH